MRRLLYLPLMRFVLLACICSSVLSQTVKWETTSSSSMIIQIVSSPTGNTIASLSNNNTVALYNAANGTMLWQFRDSTPLAKIGAIALNDSSLFWIRASRESISYPTSSDTILTSLNTINLFDSLHTRTLLDTIRVCGRALGVGELSGGIARVENYRLQSSVNPKRVSWGISLYVTYQAVNGCLTIRQNYGSFKGYDMRLRQSTELSDRHVFALNTCLDGASIALSHRAWTDYDTHVGCTVKPFAYSSTLIRRADGSTWELDTNNYDYLSAITGTSYIVTNSFLYDTLYKRRIRTWSLDRPLLIEQNTLAYVEPNDGIVLRDIQNNSEVILDSTAAPIVVTSLTFNQQNDVIIWSSITGVLRAIVITPLRRKNFKPTASFTPSDVSPLLGQTIQCLNNSTPSIAGMKFRWTLPDGSSFDSIDVVKVVNATGAYPIKLHVEWPDGRTNDTTIIITVRDATPSEARWSRFIHTDRIRALSFSHEGTYLAASFGEDSAKVLDATDGSVYRNKIWNQGVAKFSKVDDTLLYRARSAFSGSLISSGLNSPNRFGYSLLPHPVTAQRLYNPTATIDIYASEGDYDISSNDSLAIIGCSTYGVANITAPPSQIIDYAGDRFRIDFSSATVAECFDSTVYRRVRPDCGTSARYRVYQVCDLPFQNKFCFLAKPSLSSLSGSSDTNTYIGIQRYDSDSAEKLIHFNCSIIRTADDGVNIVTDRGVFDPIHEKLITELTLPTSFEVIAGTRHLVAPTVDGAEIISLVDGHIVKRYTGCVSKQVAVAVSANKRLLATGSIGGQVTLWSLPDSIMSSVPIVPQGILFYPQPTAEALTIGNLLGDMEIKMFSLEGNVMKKCTSAGVTELKLDCRELNPGVYFVQVRGAGMLVSRKVVIVR